MHTEIDLGDISLTLPGRDEKKKLDKKVKLL